jgi:tight adherence protein B
MTRVRGVIAVGGTALALVLSGTAEAAGPTLAESGGARFPDRSYVLRLPESGYVEADSVEVLENGERVSNVSVIPASRSGRNAFGVVLVVDASNSMRGAPIQAAVEAARAFAAQRNSSQQLGVVVFNRTPQVLVPLTTDGVAIDTALAAPPELASSTHLYDAVDLAVSLLQQARISPGSVVVLSDGADTGSTLTSAEVAARAREARVRIFTVGLEARALNPETLGGLAEDAGGTYTKAASTSDLEGIYRRLGSDLASEYLLRYRSLAGPDTDVHVVVRVAGVKGAAEASYRTPTLPANAAGPYRRPLDERFWVSPFAMVSVAAGSALLVTLALFALLRRRRPDVRRRLAQFVSLAEPGESSPSHRLGPIGPAGRVAERTQWWGRFKEDLEIGRVRASAAQLAVGTLAATILAVWVLSLVTPVVAVVGLAVPLAVRTYVSARAERERRRFAEQLPDNLQVVASAMRAGHSLAGALSVVVEDAPDPSGPEFKRVVADERLGIPLEDSLTAVARRMKSTDLEQVALVASLQRETGGNTAEVLDRVTDGIRERFALRRMVRTLTAQGRMSRWVLTALPVFLLVLISVINPKYMAPFFASSVGRALLVVAAVLVTAGSLVIRKIVDIKV